MKHNTPGAGGAGVLLHREGRLRKSTFTSCCVAVIVLIACSAHAAAASRPPNIILILADDLGYGEVGCYGQKKIDTPNIDRLATDGMRFTQFYAGCAVCAPSRSVLMTGLHTGHTPIRKNGGGNPLRDSDVTLAEVLKSAPTPYATGGFGKWGLGTETSSGAPTKQGFDTFFGYLHQVHAHFYYPYWLSDNGRQFMLPENEGGKRGQYSHDVILTHGLDFIRANKDKPFFCYMPVTLPHVELVVPEDSLAPYRGKFPEKPLPDPRPGYIGSDEPFATHAGMVTRLDDGVGKIVSLVHELGLDDNTLILFTSDNGPQAGAWARVVKFFDAQGPLRGTKDTLYEGGIRVPFIARWSGRIRPGTTSERASGFVDMLPTLAELTNAKPPGQLDGTSFLPTLLTGKQNPRGFHYWEHYVGKPEGMVQAVRDGDWKIMQGKPGQPFALYDLAKDVAESKDVAGEHPDIVARLSALAANEHTPPREDPSDAKSVGVKDFVR